MITKEKLKLGDLAIFNTQESLDSQVPMRTLTYNEYGLKMLNFECTMRIEELKGCIVEVLEHLDSAPWCCFPHLNLAICTHYTNLVKL